MVGIANLPLIAARNVPGFGLLAGADFFLLACNSVHTAASHLRRCPRGLAGHFDEHRPASLYPVHRSSAQAAPPPRARLTLVDDLEAVAEVAREFGWWLHVDGAYGGAGLAAPSVRPIFA